MLIEVLIEAELYHAPHILELELGFADYYVQNCFVVEAKTAFRPNDNSSRLQTFAYMMSHNCLLGFRTDGERWEALLTTNDQLLMFEIPDLQLLCRLMDAALRNDLEKIATMVLGHLE